MKFQDLVADMKSFLDSLEGLNREYLRFSTIIEQEHQLLRRRDLNRWDLLCKEKDSISKAIVLHSQAVKALSYKHCQGRMESVSQIKSLLNSMSLGDLSDGSLIQSNLLEHLRLRIEDVYNEFQKKYKTLKPLVEQNIYVVRKFFERHEDFVSTWNKALNDSDQGYSQSGRVRQQRQTSLIEIKA